MYLGCTGSAHAQYIIHFLAVSLQCTGSVHCPLSPVILFSTHVTHSTTLPDTGKTDPSRCTLGCVGLPIRLGGGGRGRRWRPSQPSLTFLPYVTWYFRPTILMCHGINGCQISTALGSSPFPVLDLVVFLSVFLELPPGMGCRCAHPYAPSRFTDVADPRL